MMEPEEDPFDFGVYMDKVRLSPQYTSFESFFFGSERSRRLR